MLLLLLSAPFAAYADWQGWWLTPDQHAQRLYGQGQYQEAARYFTSPDRIGQALFKAGDFEGAAAAYGRSSLASGAYNRGNALIMLGRYSEAIESYQSALQQQPGWVPAEQNLKLAQARKALLEPPDDDAGGTGGKLGADEIVIDNTGRVSQSEQQQVIEAGDQNLSEEALRSLWLRRVETRPADFLAVKFNAQLIQQDIGEKPE